MQISGIFSLSSTSLRGWNAHVHQFPPSHLDFCSQFSRRVFLCLHFTQSKSPPDWGTLCVPTSATPPEDLLGIALELCSKTWEFLTIRVFISHLFYFFFPFALLKAVITQHFPQVSFLLLTVDTRFTKSPDQNLKLFHS